MIAPKVEDSWLLLQAAPAARNKELGGGRDHIRSALGSEDITARFEPAGSEASCECLEQEGVCARQMLTGCCLVLKNRSVTKSAASARFLLSGSDTFETQLLFVMLRVKGCLRAALLFPLFQLPTSSLPPLLFEEGFSSADALRSFGWTFVDVCAEFSIASLTLSLYWFGIAKRDGQCGVGFGYGQGADGCWFGWLYLGTSVVDTSNPAGFPSCGALGYVRDVSLPMGSPSDPLQLKTSPSLVCSLRVPDVQLVFKHYRMRFTC